MTGTTQARRFVRLDDLPLFADDAALAAAVMGPGKLVTWSGVVTLLEGRGFPTIDPLMGGRYVPAVRAYFDREYDVHGNLQVPAPHRQAEIGKWQPRKRRAHQD